MRFEITSNGFAIVADEKCTNVEVNKIV